MNITALSLFSGCGGDTLGMKLAGINVVGYVENNKDAISTHEINFPECKLIGKDITQLTDDVFEEYVDKIDIIFGGFPCQSFSHGGKKNPKDKRGFLYQEFVRISRTVKPKIIIGENVKGLLTRKKENGQLFITDIIKEFDNIGYNIKVNQFNMKNYGIPQDRTRILIYGIKKDIDIDFNLSDIPIISQNKYIKDIIEFSLHNALKINTDFILNLIPDDKYIVNIDDNFYSTGKIPTNLVKCIENKEFSYKKRTKSTYSCIVDFDDVSRTIISTYSRMPRLFVPVKNNDSYYLRPFTVKELQRIQGFPDNFIFTGTETTKIIQIGNAIPPIFVKYVMDYIIKFLTGEYITINL